MAADVTRQRFRGALIGALVGDCYGAPFERRSTVDPRELIEQLEQLTNRTKPLHYTDDTAMSISTCKSLIENKGLDARHLAKEFSDSFFREPKRGYGPAVRTVFRSLRSSDYQDPFLPGAKQFDGHGSFGNGAAMRCVGIGLFAHREKLDDKSTIDLSEGCARITHSHVHGMNGATLLVLAIRYVLSLGMDELKEVEFLTYLIGKISPLEPDDDKIYSNKIKTILRIVENLNISGSDINQEDIVRELGNDIAAQNSVPLAIYSFLRGVSKFNDSYNIENDFLRTLHWAISCGGDTDTIASMACGLCGAYLGLNRIPENLYKNCEAWQDIMSHADQLFLDGTKR